MQCPEELGQRSRGLRVIFRWGLQRRPARQPWDDAPRPRISASGTANPYRCRHLERRRRRQRRQPPLLVFDERRGHRSSRQTHGKAVAEPIHGVVPSLSDGGQRKVREIAMLLCQQRSNQRVVNQDFCGRGRHLADVFSTGSHVVQRPNGPNDPNPLSAK
jgi:hypothetical protein